MTDGERDADDAADEPAGRKPLPPLDRVWRHPAEVAMDSRRQAALVRARRRRTTATVLGGVAATAGLLWLVRSGPTDVTLRADLVSLGGSDSEALPAEEATTTLARLAVPAATTPTSVRPTETTTLPSETSTRPSETSVPPSETLRIGTGTGTGTDEPETLAGALRIREGYLVTSGRALNGAETVVVSWGDNTAAGTVIGHDDVTDVAVIRVESEMPGATLIDASPVIAGDVVLLVDPASDDDPLHVIDEMSTSERIDGEPVVGIVELDGTLGAIPPGSPAFDETGALVGVVAATASDAPAAIVPIELVRAVADEIITHGAATHARLGVRARNPEPDEPAGSVVTRVVADGPADIGGIEVGDLIVEMGDTPIDSMESMVATLRSHEPGDAILVEVVRDGERVGCPVELVSVLEPAA